MPSWIPGHTTRERGAFLPGDGRGGRGAFHQLREEEGPEERRPEGAGPSRTWIRLAWIPSAPRGSPLPPRPVLWLGKLVGVVYLTELLTLPSSPSAPEGWPDLSMPGAMTVEGLLPTAILSPSLPLPSWFQGADGAGVCLWSPICVLRQLKLEACGRVLGQGGGGDSCGLGPRRGWAGRWEPGLSLSSPKGMGTVPGEQEQIPPSTPPTQLPCLLCQVTVSGSDQDCQDRLLKCPGGHGHEVGEGAPFPLHPAPHPAPRPMPQAHRALVA